MILFVAPVLAGTWVVPEVSIQALKQGSRIPDKVSCTIIVCDQTPVFPVNLGVSLISGPVQVRVRRTSFINRRPGSRPYGLDVRAGPSFTLDDADEPGTLWTPVGNVHPFVGMRYAHHTGDGDLLLDGYAMQVGVEFAYVADALPEHSASYMEVSYLRYVHAAWARTERQYGGFVWRAGLVVGPVFGGVNVTADPGFGFSAMFEVGLRAGLGVAD